LGLAGWRPISDDSLLLYAKQTNAQLFALKKTFHHSDQMLERWPALNTIKRSHRYLERTCVAGLEFFGTTDLADTGFERVDCLVLPQITSEASSILQPIAGSEAILKLAEQSMFFQLWSEHTERQIHLLTELAGSATCYRLLMGEDILADPMRAAEILEPATFRRLTVGS
jgi:hypothetical protein